MVTLNGETAEKIEFVNQRNATGGLSVTKVLTGWNVQEDIDAEKEFRFRVTLDDETIEGRFGDMTFTAGVAEFALKHGDTAAASGLPAGTGYTVEELLTSEDESRYSVTVTGEAEGAIVDGNDAMVVFTNEKPEPDEPKIPDEPSVTATPVIFKQLDGGDIGEHYQKFSFEMSAEPQSGMTLPDNRSGAVRKDGTVIFDEIRFTAPSLSGRPYVVTIKETNKDSGDYIYDSGYIEIEYTVTRNDETGELTVTSQARYVDGDGTGTPVSKPTLTNKVVRDERGGSLTVSKTVTGSAGDKTREFHFTVTLSDATINGTYGGMTFVNGVAEFTLKDGESRTATDLPEGVTYSVAEAEANADGYVTNAAGTAGTIEEGKTASAKFVNDKQEEVKPGRGSLVVSKTVTGAGDKTREFHFTVTLSDTAINGTYGGMTFVNGVAEFTLKDGESRTATDLPEGVTYSVEEAEANADGYVTSAVGTAGTIEEGKTASAKFVNDKQEEVKPGHGSLVVSKTVTGAGDKTREFHFTVTLSDAAINGTYGGMTFVNGVAEFTLKDGESRTATDLPEGVTYSVAEAEANKDGYVTVATGAEGTITPNGTAQAAFTNRYDDMPKTGDDTHLGLWMTLALTSMLGIVVLTVPKKRRKSKISR